MLTNEDFDGFKELIVSKIAAIKEPFEISLSGGVDSNIILFATLELGLKPRCITFYMDGYESDDLKTTRRITEHFGLDHLEIAIPCDKDSIVNDVKRVLPYCEVMKKTIIQCMIPWLYIYPRMETDTILTGLSADDLYCNQKKLVILLHRSGEEAVEPYRRSYSGDLNFSNGNIIRFGKQYGKVCKDIYHDEDVEEYFRKYPVKWLNKPKEKQLSYGAFQKYFDVGNFYRHRQSYQVNSRLRDIHDEVLLNSEWNRKGYKVIIPIYRDIEKTIGFEKLFS